MEIKASLKFIRMSPRKVRLVADLIRGVNVSEAEDQLSFVIKAAKRPILKLLNSCVANAVNNSKLSKDNLYLKAITVDGGPVLKRWKPRAFGRATPIRKRSSHITIVLGERVETEVKKDAAGKAETVKPKLVDSLKVFSKKQTKDEKDKDKSLDNKNDRGGSSGSREEQQSKGFFKKIFNRKTG